MPLVLVREVDIVIDSASVHDTREDLSALELLDSFDFTIADFLEVHINGSSVCRVYDSAYSPSESPYEAAVDDLNVLFLVFVFAKCIVIKYLEKTSPKSKEGKDDVLFIGRCLKLAFFSEVVQNWLQDNIDVFLDCGDVEVLSLLIISFDEVGQSVNPTKEQRSPSHF